MDALLEATAHVLVRDGYDRTSTNRIARTAGVNIASLYQYFSGKDALVGALIDQHLATISKIHGEHLAASMGAPMEVALRAMVHAHVLIHRTNTKLHRVLIEQIPRVERLNPIVAFRARTTELVRAWLDQRRAELRVKDLDFAAFAVVNIVDGLTQAAILEHPELVLGKKLADGLSEILLRYLVTDA